MAAAAAALLEADSLPVRPETSVGDWVGSHGGSDTVLWLSEDIGKRRQASGNINLGVFIMRRDPGHGRWHCRKAACIVGPSAVQLCRRGFVTGVCVHIIVTDGSLSGAAIGKGCKGSRWMPLPVGGDSWAWALLHTENKNRSSALTLCSGY